LYLTREGEVEVLFDLGGLASAMEAGRPMGRDRRFDGQRIDDDGGVIMDVPNHQEGEEELKIASPGKLREDEW
jgi:hypothetical protein